MGLIGVRDRKIDFVMHSSVERSRLFSYAQCEAITTVSCDPQSMNIKIDGCLDFVTHNQ